MCEAVIESFIRFIWAVLNALQAGDLVFKVNKCGKGFIDLILGDLCFELEYSEVSGHDVFGW